MSNATATPPAAAAINAGDTAFMLLSSSLVFMMTFPGLALFYGGLARSRDMLSLLMLCLVAMVVVTIQWYLFGFSLALSTGIPVDNTAATAAANPFIGDFKWTAFHNAMDQSPHPLAPTIPLSVFSAYHQQLAIITPAIAIGAGAGRGRLLPAAIFIFIWTTLVYDVLIYWVWAPNGWLHTLDGVGIYDYAGGIPVHLGCGVSAAAYALVLKARKPHRTPDLEPHSPLLVYIGTGLLWFGWAVGFNGGGAYAANARAASATVSSNLSAAVGALTWSVLDHRRTGKFSSVAMCTGAVAGLATITAGCGFVSVPASMVFGFVGASCSYFVFVWKSKLGFDDPMDVFVIHGVDGCLGILLTGLFAQRSVISLDGTQLPALPVDGSSSNVNFGGGWLDHNYRQLGVQLAGVVAGGGWAFVVSYIILRIMDAIPFLRLRVSAEEEEAGIDHSEMGEHAYGYIPLVMHAAAHATSSVSDSNESINNGDSDHCHHRHPHQHSNSATANGKPHQQHNGAHTANGNHENDRHGHGHGHGHGGVNLNGSVNGEIHVYIGNGETSDCAQHPSESGDAVKPQAGKGDNQAQQSRPQIITSAPADDLELKPM